MSSSRLPFKDQEALRPDFPSPSSAPAFELTKVADPDWVPGQGKLESYHQLVICRVEMLERWKGRAGEQREGRRDDVGGRELIEIDSFEALDLLSLAAESTSSKEGFSIVSRRRDLPGRALVKYLRGRRRRECMSPSDSERARFDHLLRPLSSASLLFHLKVQPYCQEEKLTLSSLLISFLPGLNSLPLASAHHASQPRKELDPDSMTKLYAALISGVVSNFGILHLHIYLLADFLSFPRRTDRTLDPSLSSRRSPSKGNSTSLPTRSSHDLHLFLPKSDSLSSHPFLPSASSTSSPAPLPS